MKKTNKNSLGIIAILSLVIAAVCSLTACSDDLDVQQSYPFTVEV
ncbi:TraQ conjugal transfer family protein, partial [Muribaculum intestinale]